MIFFRRFVSLFGVALCAAPILLLLAPASSAQQGSLQGNNQSQMLFELQAMRQEIAELRDMVERQAYQLRQLQSANSQTSNLTPSANRNVATTNSGYQQATPSAEYQGQTAPAFPETVLPAEGSIVAEGSLESPGYVSATNYPNASNQQDVGAVENPVSIEERPINQPQNTVPNVSYPPVEERTIGGSQARQQVPVYNPETYNQDTYNQSSAVVTETDYNQQVALENQLPTENQQGRVLADPSFPTPYQRNTPARQPVSNNIPAERTGSGSGGIVAIPQGENAQPVANTKDTPVQNPNTAGLGEQTYYQQGFELLKQSKHDEAVSTFKKQISSYPNGDYADDAHYWIAESLYVNRNLDESKLYFKSIMDKFSQSPRLPDAMLKTAYIEQEQGNVIEARILLQEIIQFHPRSNAAISAKNRLADLN